MGIPRADKPGVTNRFHHRDLSRRLHPGLLRCRETIALMPGCLAKALFPDIHSAVVGSSPRRRRPEREAKPATLRSADTYPVPSQKPATTDVSENGSARYEDKP